MIDWSRVEELRREIGDDGLAEVVELFLDEVEEAVMRLAGNGAPTADDMHFLKGSAWNLGFTDFGALCHDGERQIRAGRPIDRGAVADSYGRSKQAFLNGLRQIAQGQTPNAA